MRHQNKPLPHPGLGVDRGPLPLSVWPKGLTATVAVSVAEEPTPNHLLPKRIYPIVAAVL